MEIDGWALGSVRMGQGMGPQGRAGREEQCVHVCVCVCVHVSAEAGASVGQSPSGAPNGGRTLGIKREHIRARPTPLSVGQ